MQFSKNGVAKMCRERRKSVKPIVMAFAVFLGVGLNSAVSAGIIQYSIEGTFDAGSLAGLSYSEVFTFDDASRPDVLGGVPWVTELLSYSLNVESHSKHWSLVDWPMEHMFSQWVDTNGYLNSLAHLATPGPSGNPPAVSEFLDDGSPNSRSKHVKWYDWSRWNTIQTDSTDFNPSVTVSTVPEPSSFASLLIGVIGMIVFWRWHNNRVGIIGHPSNKPPNDTQLAAV